jgi:hypothetical protein
MEPLGAIVCASEVNMPGFGSANMGQLAVRIVSLSNPPSNAIAQTGGPNEK